MSRSLAQATDVVVARGQARYANVSPRPRKLQVLGWFPEAWVLTHPKAARPALYLTFDDGPDPVHTPLLLDLLAKHDACATFFVIGQNAERHPQLMRDIVAAGHRLGNHSWSHPRVERLRTTELRAEIERTHALLQSFDGAPRHDFRPPHGSMPARMLLDCALRSHRIAYWTYDSLDYSHREPHQLVACMREHPVRAGEIILMHDDSTHSLEMLRVLLPEWRQAGFALLPLPDSQGAQP